MKKLILTLTVLSSLTATANNDLAHLSKMKVSQDNIEAIQKIGSQKMRGGWECEAQAFDGAGGIGRGSSRYQAASMAVNYCRSYSMNPRSCSVQYCGRL